MRSISPNTKETLLALGAILWLTVAVSVYYVSNKPLTPQAAGHLLMHAGRLAAAVMILSICGGLGRKISRFILDESRDKFARLALLSIEASLGIAALGTAVLIIGGTVGIRPWIAWLLVVLLGAGLYKDILNWWRGWTALGDLWKSSGGFGRTVAIGAAAILTFTLWLSLAPPIKFDALVYHLAIPHEYLSQGRIAYLPGNMYWGMPELAEMLYLLGMALAGDPAAAVVGWMFGAAALAGLLGYVNGLFGERAAWAAVASLLAGYTLAVSLSWGYADWPALFFGGSFLMALDSWRREGQGRFLALAGLFAGAALGTKYTAGVLLLCGAGLVLWQGRQSRVVALKPLLLFLGFAGLAAAPWWAKNLIATGNPFYPLLFPAGAMTPVRLDFYQSHPVHRSWIETLLLPLFVTWSGVEGAPGYGASIGPLLLGFGGLAWIRREQGSHGQREATRTAAFVLVSGLIIWAVASRLSDLLTQTRLYFAVLPAAAVLAGIGFAALGELRLPQVRLGRIGGAFLLLALGLNVVQVGMLVADKGIIKLLTGGKSNQAYLEENLGWYVPAMQAIEALPAEARVLALWEPRGLYCRPKCQPDEILDRWVTAVREHQEPALILEKWRTAGFSHILVYRLGAEFIREDDPRYQASEWQALDQFLAYLPPPTDFGGVYELYSITP